MILSTANQGIKMELINTKQAIELIRQELGVKKININTLARYRELGFISKHNPKHQRSSDYLKSNILSGIKYIEEYRSRNKLRGSKPRINIDATSGCNLFLILMNKNLQVNDT